MSRPNHRCYALVATLSALIGCRDDLHAPGPDLPQPALTAGGYSNAVPLPSLPGATGSRANGITDNGIIVGETDFPSGERATIWHVGGPPLDLGTLPGHYRSVATAINNFAVVVGYSCPQSGRCKPFMWTPQNGMSAMSVGSFAEATPYAINDNMIAVGTGYPPLGATYEDQAVLWTKTGTLVKLAAAGAITSGAEDINNSNVIVGFGIDSTSKMHGYRWEYTAPGKTIGPPGPFTYPQGINSAGVITGEYKNPPLVQVFQWNAGTYSTLLTGRFSGRDISDRGRVIMTPFDTDTLPRTWHAGAWAELPGLGGSTSVSAVNTCGTIVGTAYRADDTHTAVKWVRRECDR